jgi:hypothetical protein
LRSLFGTLLSNRYQIGIVFHVVRQFIRAKFQRLLSNPEKERDQKGEPSREVRPAGEKKGNGKQKTPLSIYSAGFFL